MTTFDFFSGINPTDSYVRSDDPPPTGGELRFYRIAPTLTVECSASYTAAASAAVAAAAAAAHILSTIGRTMMRAAGGRHPPPPRQRQRRSHNLVGPAGSWFRSSAASAAVVPAATALRQRHSAANLCPPVANYKYLRFPVCDSTY